MKLKFKLLFVVISIMSVTPLTANAFSFEDLAEALSSRRACPVEEIE